MDNILPTVTVKDAKSGFIWRVCCDDVATVFLNDEWSFHDLQTPTVPYMFVDADFFYRLNMFSVTSQKGISSKLNVFMQFDLINLSAS